jgi:P-type E1-E2 ATPase
VEGNLHGKDVLIGSAQLLTERLGHCGPPVAETPGALVACVAVAGEPVGLLRFTGHLRPGAAEMIGRLRAMGARYIGLITGDNALNAHAVGSPLGMDHIRADMLPEDKVHAVREAMGRFHGVVMVGDGINDAPALAAATVGVAMGAHGTGVSAQAADIVLLEDDVTKVTEAVVIGRRMLFIAKQSIYVGLGLSFTFMVAAAFGKIPPAVGALLQEAVDIAVILNALRARGSTAPSGYSRV